MTLDLWLLLAAAGLYFVMIMLPTTGSLLKHSVAWASGARDKEVEVPVWVARAKRAQANMQENMVIFVPLMLIAHLAHPDHASTILAGYIFLGAWVVYVPLYLKGIAYLRTLYWMVSIGGMGLIVSSLIG